MTEDSLRQVWRAESARQRVVIDVDLVLNEIRRNAASMRASVLVRDALEIGTGVLLIPTWVLLGWGRHLHWTWYLEVPALVWIIAFLLWSHRRKERHSRAFSEPLRSGIEHSLAEVRFQIWLLRNVLWWYVFPLAVPALLFLGVRIWDTMQKGSAAWLTNLLILALFLLVCVFVYRFNLRTIREKLKPRMEELEVLLRSLEGDASEGKADVDGA